MATDASTAHCRMTELFCETRLDHLVASEAGRVIRIYSEACIEQIADDEANLAHFLVFRPCQFKGKLQKCRASLMLGSEEN